MNWRKIAAKLIGATVIYVFLASLVLGAGITWGQEPNCHVEHNTHITFENGTWYEEIVKYCTPGRGIAILSDNWLLLTIILGSIAAIIYGLAIYEIFDEREYWL